MTTTISQSLAEMTHKEIATETGTSRQSVQQAEKRGRAKVRDILDFVGPFWADPSPDPWRLMPSMTLGCRQVGALRFRRWRPL